MGASENFPLSLTVRAVDKATLPLAGISAAVKKLAAPMKGVVAATKKFGSETFKLGSTFVGLGVGAAAGLFAVGHSAMEAGDELDQLSKRAGMTATAYASLRYAAAQADVEQEAFNGSITMFSKGLGQAKAGSGRFLTFLKKTSPELAKQITQVKSTEEGLGLMSKAMVKLKDPSKRVALSMAAFGDAQMGEFFAQGGAEIEEFRKRFVQLAGTQDRFADRAGVLDNSLRETKFAFLSLRNGMMTELFPAFNRLAIMLTDFMVQNREGLIQWAREANKAFQGWVNSGGMDRLVQNLKDLADKGLKLVEVLGGIKGAALATAGVMSIDLTSSVVGLAGSLLKLNNSASDAKGGLIGLVAGPLIKFVKNAVLAKQAGYGLAESLKMAGAVDLKPLLVTAGPWLALAAALGAVAAASYQVYKNWDGLKQSNFADVGAWAKSLVGIDESEDEMLARVSRGGTQGIVRPKLGAARAGQSLQGATSRQTNDAHVTVELKNAPKGTRVAVDPKSTASVDTSMGITMPEAH